MLRQLALDLTRATVFKMPATRQNYIWLTHKAKFSRGMYPRTLAYNRKEVYRWRSGRGAYVWKCREYTRIAPRMDKIRQCAIF